MLLLFLFEMNGHKKCSKGILYRHHMWPHQKPLEVKLHQSRGINSGLK